MLCSCSAAPMAKSSRSCDTFPPCSYLHGQANKQWICVCVGLWRLHGEHGSACGKHGPRLVQTHSSRHGQPGRLMNRWSFSGSLHKEVHCQQAWIEERRIFWFQPGMLFQQAPCGSKFKSQKMDMAFKLTFGGKAVQPPWSLCPLLQPSTPAHEPELCVATRANL